jgi:hypothetical protein
MKIEEIKLGMVFKDNDKRFTRWVRIVEVNPNGRLGFTSSRDGVSGPWSTIAYVSRKPGRFHAEPKSSGYSLVTA